MKSTKLYQPVREFYEFVKDYISFSREFGKDLRSKISEITIEEVVQDLKNGYNIEIDD